MRILLINPNMTQSMTDAMTDVARNTAKNSAQIIPVTATKGFPYISSLAEAQIAGAHLLETIAYHRSEVDAVIIAAFGDPGLLAARELFDLPIVGMAEAAVLTAAMLGDRVGVVTFSPEMAKWYRACVLQTGLGARFTGVRYPAAPPGSLEGIATALKEGLITLIHQTKDKDYADVIILGGAPLAGLAAKIATETTCILVDPISAATAQAMALLQLKPTYSSRSARPKGKISTGLSPALTAVLKGEQP